MEETIISVSPPNTISIAIMVVIVFSIMFILMNGMGKMKGNSE